MIHKSFGEIEVTRRNFFPTLFTRLKWMREKISKIKYFSNGIYRVANTKSFKGQVHSSKALRICKNVL